MSAEHNRLYYKKLLIHVVLVILYSRELSLHIYIGMVINFTLITKVFHGIDG